MGLTQRLGTIPLAIFTDASNNIGIGGSPSGSYKFEVTGTGRVSGNLTANRGIFGTAGDSSTQPIYTSNAQGTQILMNSTRNGGGGIVLQSSGTDAVYLGTANWVGISGYSTSSTDIALAAQQSTAGIVFATGPSVIEKMKITSAGHVGIGTSNPGSSFPNGQGWTYTTQRRVLEIMSTSTDANSGIFLRRPDNNTGLDLWSDNYWGDAYIDERYQGNIVFRNNTASSPAEKMRINPSGYIKASSIGSYLSPTTPYHEFVANAVGNPIAVFSNFASSNPYGIEVNFQNTDPNNASYYVFGSYAASPSFVWIYRIWSNGTISSRSDARWKKNIETTRNGYLEDLCKLRVVKYNWYNHEDDAPKELGLIAQEVEEVFPNLIQYDKVTTKKQIEQEDGTFIEQEVEDGESRSIKVSVLPYMLLKALQEANAKIDELSARLAVLENKA